MGSCWNCNTEITLGEERTKCDVCGNVIFYRCNNCKEEFKVLDKETKKKLRECKICGYFICPHCSICSLNCNKYEWEREILKILRPEITQGNQPTLLDKVKKIRKYFEYEKGGKENRVCSERGVLISYAKNRIKSLLAKSEGFRVKDGEDKNAFIKRIEEITAKELNTELKISEVREDGSYGQEYRDAFNLLVCLGKLKIVKKSFEKDGEIRKYDSYIRCEKEPCHLLSKDDLIINECKNQKHIGNKRFPLNATHCPTCKTYQKGKDKGKLRKLKRRPNDKDSCQLYRGIFY